MVVNAGDKVKGYEALFEIYSNKEMNGALQQEMRALIRSKAQNKDPQKINELISDALKSLNKRLNPKITAEKIEQMKVYLISRQNATDTKKNNRDYLLETTTQIINNALKTPEEKKAKREQKQKDLQAKLEQEQKDLNAQVEKEKKELQQLAKQPDLTEEEKALAKDNQAALEKLGENIGQMKQVVVEPKKEEKPPVPKKLEAVIQKNQEAPKPPVEIKKPEEKLPVPKKLVMDDLQAALKIGNAVIQKKEEAPKPPVDVKKPEEKPVAPKLPVEVKEHEFNIADYEDIGEQPPVQKGIVQEEVIPGDHNDVVGEELEMQLVLLESAQSKIAPHQEKEEVKPAVIEKKKEEVKPAVIEKKKEEVKPVSAEKKAETKKEAQPKKVESSKLKKFLMFFAKPFIALGKLFTKCFDYFKKPDVVA